MSFCLVQCGSKLNGELSVNLMNFLFCSLAAEESNSSLGDSEGFFIRMFPGSPQPPAPPSGLPLVPPNLFHTSAGIGSSGQLGTGVQGGNGVVGPSGLALSPHHHHSHLHHQHVHHGVHDPASSLAQPYSNDMPHYGPIYYSSYANSLKSNRTAPYATRSSADPYYSMYQNFYRPPPVSSNATTYDAR